MEETNDGFRIAEKDLELRGPGEFLGTRQSGLPDFRAANLLRDGALLRDAQEDAAAWLAVDPGLVSPASLPLRAVLEARWAGRLELAGSGKRCRGDARSGAWDASEVSLTTHPLLSCLAFSGGARYRRRALCPLWDAALTSKSIAWERGGVMRSLVVADRPVRPGPRWVVRRQPGTAFLEGRGGALIPSAISITSRTSAAPTASPPATSSLPFLDGCSSSPRPFNRATTTTRTFGSATSASPPARPIRISSSPSAPVSTSCPQLSRAPLRDREGRLVSLRNFNSIEVNGVTSSATKTRMRRYRGGGWSHRDRFHALRK